MGAEYVKIHFQMKVLAKFMAFYNNLQYSALTVV